MQITGKDIVDAVAKRLNEQGIPPHDSDIVGAIQRLDHQEVNQLLTFGDVLTWHNDRIEDPDAI